MHGLLHWLPHTSVRAVYLCFSQVEIRAGPRCVVALTEHEPLAAHVALRPLQQVRQQLRCQVRRQGVAYNL